MVLGCMFATQTEELSVSSSPSFAKAIQYIAEAEDIQRKLIRKQTIERENPRSPFFQINTD